MPFQGSKMMGIDVTTRSILALLIVFLLSDVALSQIIRRPFPGVRRTTQNSTTAESTTLPSISSPQGNSSETDLLRERWNFPGTISPTSSHSACVLNGSVPGICRPISQCPSVLRNVATVRPVHCSFRGEEPIVCCPLSGRRAVTNAVVDGTFSRLRVNGCGKRPLRPISGNSTEKRPLIVGGQESEPFSWPWMAALVIIDELEDWRFHCGAALINKRYAITTAHCFAADLRNSRIVDPHRYALRVLVHDRDNGTLVTLTNIIVHEDYVIRQSYNDIALLEMTEDLQFSDLLRPVCIPNTNVDETVLDWKNAWVTGWGDTEFGGSSSQVLREVKLRIFNNSECDKNYQTVARSAFPDGISDKLVCAGHTKGGRDACQGDSGGPLVFYYNAKWNLVGLVSFGYGCAFRGFPGVYTRITSFLPWIETNTGGLV